MSSGTTSNEVVLGRALTAAVAVALAALRVVLAVLELAVLWLAVAVDLTAVRLGAVVSGAETAVPAFRAEPEAVAVALWYQAEAVAGAVVLRPALAIHMRCRM